ncbi:MAG: NAD-dependent epimerase/dehydratase family protein [Actinomycetota bacterium]
MRALVTGGAGFIGSAIARELLARGTEVRVLDNLLTGSRAAVPQGAELVEGDLRNPDDVRAACRGVEVVFHQAAVRSVPRSVDEPVLVEECNSLGTVQLLAAAAEAGVRRLVYASSSSVYGDVGQDLNREDRAPDPMSPYAVSKLAGEKYCRVWTLLGRLSTVAMRYFNVFGPGQAADSKYAAVFPAFCSALVAGRAPEVHWDGEQSRDFTFVDDVVRANLLAAEAGPDAVGQVVNVAGGRPRTVNEVLRSVADAVGRWIDPERLPRRAGDVRRTHADISRAERLLGWRPEADWDPSVRATVGWFTTGEGVSGAAVEARDQG